MYQWHHLPLLTSSYSYHGISMTLLLRTCPRVWGHHYPALVPWLPLKERCYTGRSSTQSLVRRFTGTSVSDPDPDWIRIQGSSGNRFGIRIRFQGLKKRSKMSNNHNTILLFSYFYTILLLFSDFYNILSFNGLLLIRKSYNYEVIKKMSDTVVVRIEIFGWIRIWWIWIRTLTGTVFLPLGDVFAYLMVIPILNVL